MDYLNRGFAICNRCGAVMDRREDPRGGCDIYAFEEEPVMDITKKVAALRFKYHANMLDVCNVLNQIGILKDEKAESVMKNHTMQCFDCLERLGYPIEKFLKEQEKES